MEYRIAQGWRVAAAVFCVALVAGGFALCSAILHNPGNNNPQVAVIMSIIFAGTGAMLWAVAVKTRIIIDDGSITKQGVFGSTQLSLNEITGYRKEKDYLYLLSKQRGKSIRISNSYENYAQLKSWIYDNYQDADQIIVAEETKEILADEEFGSTLEEREMALAKAKKVAGFFNIVGLAIPFWLILYPKPYQLAWVLTLLLPYPALYILWRFKGLVTINSAKASAYPTLLFVFGASGILACIRAVVDYNLYLYNAVWQYVAAVCAILTAVTYYIAYTGHAKTINKKPFAYLLLAFFAAYGYGATVFVNGHFDVSAPRVFTQPVTNKRISRGKSTSYYLSVAPWGRYTDGEEIRVSLSLYQSVSTGDSLNIFLQQGRLGIPWYFVEKKEVYEPPTQQ